MTSKRYSNAPKEFNPMSFPIKSPRKLIEVALPLDAINEACAYEKMPGIGAHPRGIHLWWSRKPLAAARAILFAQLVNDPGTNIGRGFKYGTNRKVCRNGHYETFCRVLVGSLRLDVLRVC
jgi:Protein of unknown function (DUF1156)